MCRGPGSLALGWARVFGPGMGLGGLWVALNGPPSGGGSIQQLRESNEFLPPHGTLACRKPEDLRLPFLSGSGSGSSSSSGNGCRSGRALAGCPSSGGSCCVGEEGSANAASLGSCCRGGAGADSCCVSEEGCGNGACGSLRESASGACGSLRESASARSSLQAWQDPLCLLFQSTRTFLFLWSNPL